LVKSALPALEESASAHRLLKSRSDRRREDTRRKLLRATYEIVAERGLEGLVIQDITARADVGYGSFYNHFPSKDAIVSAAIEAFRLHTKGMYENLDGLTSDRVEAFANDVRVWLRVAKTDRMWGWFMIRAVLSGNDFRFGIGDLIRRAVAAGIEEGVFRHQDIDMARETVAGLLLLATLKLVSGEVDDDYADRIISTALSVLGVPDASIREVMAKPLPDVALPAFLAAA